jgi:hypothetical protein
MFESLIFRLIALALLIAYLGFSREKRLRADEAKWRAREREKEKARRQAWKDLPPGAAMDVASMLPQLQQLRENHLTALHVRRHEAFYRRGLLAVFRKFVTSRSLFQRGHLERELQKRNA